MNGTITKRPTKNGNPSWGYSFFAGRGEAGKRLQITKSGFDTKREASEALREAIRVHQAGPAAAPPSVTLSAFFDRWMTEYAFRHCEPKTVERYRQLGEYLMRKIGTVELSKLTVGAIETALHELEDAGGRITREYPKGRPLKPKTVRHIAFVLNGCLRKAVKLQLIPSNPMSLVDLPKAEPHEAMCLDRDRVKQLLDAGKGTRLFPLLTLAAATGCRRGELLALEWSDVDLTSGVLLVSKSLEDTEAGVRVKSTKSGKPRRFIVPAQAIEVLKAHRVQQDGDRLLFGSDYEDHNLVFCKPEGGYYRPDAISSRVTELARAVGLEGVGLHTLRHSHASQLLSSGAPIPVVAKRLGHANANVTLQIYSHALEADEIAAAKIWNDAMAELISSSGGSK